MKVTALITCGCIGYIFGCIGFATHDLLAAVVLFFASALLPLLWILEI